MGCNLASIGCKLYVAWLVYSLRSMHKCKRSVTSSFLFNCTVWNGFILMHIKLISDRDSIIRQLSSSPLFLQWLLVYLVPSDYLNQWSLTNDIMMKFEQRCLFFVKDMPMSVVFISNHVCLDIRLLSLRIRALDFTLILVLQAWHSKSISWDFDGHFGWRHWVHTRSGVESLKGTGT